MKYLRTGIMLLLVVALAAGCGSKWYNDWKTCAVAGAVVGGTVGGYAAGDPGYGIAGGAVGGGLLGGLICALLAEEPDSDGDGVPDSRDECPNTPMGVQVDERGCPIDTDGDGVPDYLDKCPNTPRGVKVDRDGCPLDTDGDGVPDYKDKCPNTPRGVQVDIDGCPIDSDGDGIPDYLDKCPNKFGLAKYDGCPDTDGDGVPDNKDDCPTVFGRMKNGCPAKLLGILFDFDKSNIRSDQRGTLETAAFIMKENPDVRVLIEGHTCNIGTSRYNLGLSERRARSTKNYLVKQGISPTRMETIGKGESDPKYPNTSEANRKLNRRINFISLDR